MRIVFVIKSLNKCGGIERVTSILANALQERGYEIHIISYIKESENPFFKIDARIKCYYLAGRRDQNPIIVRDIRRVTKMKKLFRQINPDIIIQEGASGSISSVPASKGYKIIGCEHSSMDHHRYIPITNLSRLIFAKCTNRIVTLTEYDAEQYRKRFAAQNTITIPNPVVLNTETVSDLSEKVVVSVGRLTVVKGFDMLLRAWKKIEDKGWTLRIVGSGKWHKKMLKQIKTERITNVELIPASQTIEQEYRKASLYVCSSRSECFPLTQAEALTMGLPVVSFDCGAGPREIVKDGVSGMIVAANNINELATALEQLMDNPIRLKEMSKAALADSNRFQLDAIIETWEKLFKEVSEE